MVSVRSYLRNVLSGSLINKYFHAVPIGVSILPEVENEGGVEKRHLFTERAYESTVAEYNDMLEEIKSKEQ